MKTPKVLTIAGLDSSGGAGISADLKTFAALKTDGAAIVTAITAQNAEEVKNIFPLPPTVVSRQLETTLKEIKPYAVKTGMLYNGRIMETIVKKLKKYKIKNMVIDPVMTSTSGKPLIEKNAIKTLVKKLFPLAILVTPNIEEAQKIAGVKIKTTGDVKTACKKINELGAKNVIIKGGHLTGKNCTDILYFKGKFYRFASPRIKTKNIRGTGCTLSAAIAVYLAKGFTLPDACKKAKKYILQVIMKNRASFL